MPTLSAPPIPQSRFKITSSAFPGTYFTKFSGIEDASENSTYADGLDFRLFYLLGLSKLNEMTIEIPFSPTIHDELILYKKENPCSRFTVVITPLECDGTNLASSRKIALQLTSCQLTKVQAYTVDRNNSTPSMITLSFVADDYTLK